MHESEIVGYLSGELKKLNTEIEGEFPDGKLNESDEGATTVGICLESGIVKIVFGKPIAWVGFSPDQAIELAMRLIKHAKKAGLTKPVTIEL